MTAASWDTKLDQEYRDTVEAEHIRRKRKGPNFCRYCGQSIRYNAATCRNCQDLPALDRPEAKG